jgi:hypothetical protein
MSNTNDKRRAFETREDWERVLTAAAHLQQIIPDAVLVGGSAAAIHADHRFSYDDDHVVVNLKDRYDQVLKALEDHAGWVTNRLKPPVMILGDLDGVETGIRNLIRREPLQTVNYETPAGIIALPTLCEMTRIKAFLIVTRNATRDFIDFVALSEKLEQDRGAVALRKALGSLDRLYPQTNGASVLLQLAKQLSEPKPKDLGNEDLSVYRLIQPKWNSWNTVNEAAQRLGVMILHYY